MHLVSLLHPAVGSKVDTQPHDNQLAGWLGWGHLAEEKRWVQPIGLPCLGIRVGKGIRRK